MKLLSLLTCSMATLVGLIGMATAGGPVCWWTHDSFTRHYKIKISPVPKEEVGPLCHEFWKNLKGHWLCTVSSPHGCGPWTNTTFPDKGVKLEGVEWKFTVIRGCNSGMVESAFWGATKNKYGAIDCH